MNNVNQPREIQFAMRIPEFVETVALKIINIKALISATLLAGIYVPGCTPPEEFVATPNRTYPCTVYVEPALKDSLKEACEVWYPVGLQCRIVTARESAEVSVEAVTGPCEQEGNYEVLATTDVLNKNILLYEHCTEADRWPEILAHEFGHGLSGRGTHIPTSADRVDAELSEEKVYKNGKLIYGAALMNGHDSNPDYMTSIDNDWFLMRVRERSWVGYTGDCGIKEVSKINPGNIKVTGGAFWYKPDYSEGSGEGIAEAYPEGGLIPWKAGSYVVKGSVKTGAVAKIENLPVGFQCQAAKCGDGPFFECLSTCHAVPLRVCTLPATEEGVEDANALVLRIKEAKQ